MKEATGNAYVKRTQKDYSMSFKLGLVQEVERGLISVKEAQRKYGSREIQRLFDGSENTLTLIWDGLLQPPPHQKNGNLVYWV